ncbi:phosphatase PAP2 family protein [Virgibacillus necropolis]|uniref:phosphatase PAP2 family protein n=1 Tax=Virgibacillus necropolis TaxID=163877 RepID=UPI00384B65B1
MRNKSQYLYIFLLSFVLFTTALWILKITRGNIPFVDQWTKEFVVALDDSYIYFIFRWITELGSGTFLTPFTIIMGIVLWIIFRDWLVGVMFAGGTYLSNLLNVGIKHIVERERPRILEGVEAHGSSFPSGHAMISLACYGLLVYFLSKKIKSEKAIIALQISASILIFLIGFSRYIIRVHYLTDVLAGFAFGFIFILLWTLLYEFIVEKRKRLGQPRQV